MIPWHCKHGEGVGFIRVLVLLAYGMEALHAESHLQVLRTSAEGILTLRVHPGGLEPACSLVLKANIERCMNTSECWTPLTVKVEGPSGAAKSLGWRVRNWYRETCFWSPNCPRPRCSGYQVFDASLYNRESLQELARDIVRELKHHEDDVVLVIEKFGSLTTIVRRCFLQSLPTLKVVGTSRATILLEYPFDAEKSAEVLPRVSPPPSMFILLVNQLRHACCV
eukprot:jgi/Botrbrau1/6075/Bobra.177_1s0014.1